MTKLSDIKCRICGKNALEINKRGAYLKRVNPKGELPMVVQCAPTCHGLHGKNEDALLNALDGVEIIK